MSNDDLPNPIRKQTPRIGKDPKPDRHEDDKPQRGWMGDVAGPGCDPDVGDQPDEEEEYFRPKTEERVNWKIIPEKPSTHELHKHLLNAAEGGIRQSRENAMGKGHAPNNLIGFAWDLRDKLLPPAVLNSPMVQSLLEKTPPDKTAYQSGVLTRNEMIVALKPLAYQLEHREPPLLISASHVEPQLILKLQQHDPGWLLVVVIVNKKLSLHALQVSDLITQAASQFAPIDLKS